MPNRGELPSPAQRARNVTAIGGAATPATEAWTIIAFCAIGCLMSFYMAVSSAGIDALPRLMAQVPLG